jgi:lysophospholipase L1-like esterase
MVQMTAKNGWAGSFRRAFGICLALALIGSAIMASTASAKKPVLPANNYIALGDSISYGYSQQKFEESIAKGEPGNPALFETGFVNLLSKKLAKIERQSGHSLVTANLSCPGEISDGLIGENAELGGHGEGNGANDSQPCGWHNADGLPRHFEYGPVSQLEAAVGIATGAIGGGSLGTTNWVTLQIGSNDELAVVHACLTPSYDAEKGFAGGAEECLLHEAGPEGFYYKGGLFGHIITNLGDTVGVLRHFGYTGRVAILGFYNPQAIILAGSDVLQKKLNETITEYITPKAEGGKEAFGPGVVIADPFSTINPQKGNTVEGKAICKYTEECNPHDKYVDFVKYLEAHGMSHAEAEAYAEAHKKEAEEFPEGDIHPTHKGHQLFAKLLLAALTTGKNTGGA